MFKIAFIIAGMLHVLTHAYDSVMAEISLRSSRLTLTISPYTRTLKTIATNITEEDLSSIKLILQAENWFKKKTLDDLKNPQELLRVLQGRGLISKGNQSFLSTLLTEIHRKDLAKMLQSDGSGSDLTPDGDCTKTAPEENTGGSQPLSQMSVDEYDDDDNEVIMSSQSSLSDEEKLQVLNVKKVSDCQ